MFIDYCIDTNPKPSNARTSDELAVIKLDALQIMTRNKMF